MHHFELQVWHMITACLVFLLHSIWLVATPYVAFKRYRNLWLVEGLALGLICGIFGFLIELFFMTDYSAGRKRPASEAWPPF